MVSSSNSSPLVPGVEGGEVDGGADEFHLLDSALLPPSLPLPVQDVARQLAVDEVHLLPVVRPGAELQLAHLPVEREVPWGITLGSWC